MINPRWLELPLSRTNFHGPKVVLVIEVRLYILNKIIVRYKKIGYNIDVLRKTACLVVNPIKINNFDCTTVGRPSD